MRKVVFLDSFHKTWKTLKKKHFNSSEIDKVVKILASGEKLAGKYKDHALSGNLKGFRECHIEKNWLLIYRTNEDRLELIATGSHDDLFK